MVIVREMRFGGEDSKRRNYYFITIFSYARVSRTIECIMPLNVRCFLVRFVEGKPIPTIMFIRFVIFVLRTHNSIFVEHIVHILRVFGRVLRTYYFYDTIKTRSSCLRSVRSWQVFQIIIIVFISCTCAYKRQKYRFSYTLTVSSDTRLF